MRSLIMYSTAAPTPGHVHRLRELGADPVVAHDEAQAVAAAGEAEIILGHRYLWQTLPHAEQLRWVQSSAGGIDHLIVPDLFRCQPVLSRCPIFGPVIARHALALLLALERGLGGSNTPLNGVKRVLIHGLGFIGGPLAELLAHLGIEVIGVTRTGRDPNGCCVRVCDASGWKESLTEVDAWVLCCPRTPQTVGLADAANLARAKPGLILINVGRGQLVDHDALVFALQSGQVAAAGLDVVDGYPESVLQRLRALPNVILSPKTASFCPDRQARFEAFVEAQVARYLRGHPPLHRVDYPTTFTTLTTLTTPVPHGKNEETARP